MVWSGRCDGFGAFKSCVRSLSLFAVANSLLWVLRETMFHAQGTCSVLVVTCGEISEDKRGKETPEDKLRYPFPELVSSGRLEVSIG